MKIPSMEEIIEICKRIQKICFNFKTFTYISNNKQPFGEKGGVYGF
jgi:hypothetical protein